MSEAALSLAESRQREFRRMVALSAAFHVALSVAAVISLPSPFDDAELPAGPIIEMVTPAELAARTAAVARVPKPAPPEPEPKPEPVAEPVAPPPPPPTEQIIIPEDTNRKPAPPKPKPAPAPVREVETRPQPAEEEEQVDLEAFLLEQRILNGEIPRAKEAEKPQVVPGAGGTGAPDSPEIAAWKQRVRQHIRRNWTPAQGFRGKRLTTLVNVSLTAGGDLLDYDTERSSGNPWFDDSVERYLEGEDALPPPPYSGEFQILFDGDL